MLFRFRSPFRFKSQKSRSHPRAASRLNARLKFRSPGLKLGFQSRSKSRFKTRSPLRAFFKASIWRSPWVQGSLALALGGILLGTVSTWSNASSPSPVQQQTVTPALSLTVQSFKSTVMGTTRQYGVILPPGYDSNPTQRYPVIVLLHGGHNTLTVYTEHYGLLEVLKSLYDSQRLPPALIVMPDGNDRRGSSALWDPQYYNGPNGNLDRFIGSELVQQVQSHYRTLPGPQFWALGGVSSGAWGAFNIGLRHLNTFGTLFSHSGYFTDDSGAANSPVRFIRTLPHSAYQHLAAYMDAGSGSLDEEMRSSSEEFHTVLNQLGIPNVLHIFPGGHGNSGPDIGWNYFRHHLADSLGYVGQRFITEKEHLNHS